MPLMTRPLFRRELPAWAFIAIMIGALDGGIVSVLAKNAYDGLIDDRLLNLAVAALSSITTIGSVMSFLWTAVSRGRDKVRFMRGFFLASLGALLLVAIAPRTPVGLMMVVLAAMTSAMAWSGVVTLRPVLWRANYPSHARARMTGKFASVQSVMLAVTGIAIGYSLNRNPEAYHYLYPIAAAFGLIGVKFFAGLRMRGGPAAIERERSARHGASSNPMVMLSILREDGEWRRFMTAMMVFGLGTIASTVPLVIIQKEVFGFQYFRGMLNLTCIPVLVVPLILPLWSRLLDRVHSTRFRAIHSWAFVIANLFLLIAAVFHAEWALWAGSVWRGVAFAGGAVAWNLGHLDFAPPDRASQYMSVHVTLEGIRGILGPMIGLASYSWLESLHLGAGAWAFAVSTLLTVVGAMMFVRLSNRLGDRARRDHRRTPAMPAPTGGSLPLR